MFSRGRLLAVLIDLFGGGFDTSATTLQWALLLLLHHPDAQDRIHREIDEAVEKSQHITWEDRDKLPYTEAVMWETLRLYPVFLFTAPHRSTETATIGNYEFPPGSRIMFHLFSIHRDPELWEAPDDFRPERFLENGKLKLPDFHVAFSAGRRSCIGEQLARKEVFLLFANLLHNFKVILPAGSKQPGPLTMNRGSRYNRHHTTWRFSLGDNLFN
ncbi:cytochrome P450 2U1-like [Paramacrobiotus metropolitanus]|uniref:cytochrome P450 2U1-like n=1 Tax=Paramacrobiotus metropolitanus TaxID=2943436 RepID=UPI002445BF1F|nr:cytochrome P450 2U1-like [Paramacrobiotus metropolitanus]